MKLCKDCKHFRSDGSQEYWAKCHHPKTRSVNPVTGESTGRYCDWERKWGWLETRASPATCGKEARWFETK